MLPFDDQPTYVPQSADFAREELRFAKERESLWRAITALQDDHRTVILLRQQMDLDFADIAERMRLSSKDAGLLWGQAILELGERLRDAKPTQ